MSVDISVSSKNSSGCREILKKLQECNINARTIDTVSVIDGEIETGCLLTLGREYIEKDRLIKLWKNIQNNYTCCHLNINGIFNGCIYNYISDDKCPGNI